jgi:PAS domain S-box-containing protein
MEGVLMQKKPTYEELEQRVKELENRGVDHKLSEKAIRESEARYRAIVEDQTELICRWLPGGMLTFVNGAYCRYFGKKSEELIGHNFMPLIPEEDHEKVERHFASIAPGNPVSTHEHRVITPNGEIRWHQWSNRAIFDAQGCLVEFQSVGRDITARKRMEEELRKARDELEQRVVERTAELLKANEQLRREIVERRRSDAALIREKENFRILVEESPLGVAVVGKDGHYKYINPKFVKIFGYSREDIPTGRDWFNRAFPDLGYRNQVISTWINDFRESNVGESRPRTFRVRCKDGTERIIHFRPVTLETQDQLVIYEDITEGHRAEEQLRRHALRNDRILQTAMDAFFILDRKGNILEINDAASRVYGYSREELVGLNIYDIETTPPHETMKPYEKLIRKKAYRFETKHRRKDGRIIDIEASTNFVDIDDGFFFGFFRDITDNKRAHLALSQGEAELEKKNRDLKELNTALKVLLEKRLGYKAELEENVLSNVKELIIPYLERLKKKSSDRTQEAYMNVLESNLKEIISPFSRRFSNTSLYLTPTQIQVANLVKENKTTKEIAGLLGLSEKTIEDHRKNIRKKLGILNKKVNLKSYLVSMH